MRVRRVPAPRCAGQAADMSELSAQSPAAVGYLRLHLARSALPRQRVRSLALNGLTPDVGFLGVLRARLNYVSDR